jgi:hypothetical protein
MEMLFGMVGCGDVESGERERLCGVVSARACIVVRINRLELLLSQYSRQYSRMSVLVEQHLIATVLRTRTPSDSQLLHDSRRAHTYGPLTIGDRRCVTVAGMHVGD